MPNALNLRSLRTARSVRANTAKRAAGRSCSSTTASRARTTTSGATASIQGDSGAVGRDQRPLSTDLAPRSRHRHPARGTSAEIRLCHLRRRIPRQPLPSAGAPGAPRRSGHRVRGQRSGGLEAELRVGRARVPLLALPPPPSHAPQRRGPNAHVAASRNRATVERILACLAAAAHRGPVALSTSAVASPGFTTRSAGRRWISWPHPPRAGPRRS